MSNEKKRSMLLVINRILIYVFGMIGIYTGHDEAYVVSLTLWVWLPYCVKVERYIYSILKR